MYFLYEKKYSADDAYVNELDVLEYRPTLFKPFIPNEGDGSLKNRLSRIWFWLISGGKAKIAYVQRDGIIVHTSYVIPKCYKFPFMKKGDLEIGPCTTKQEYRGQGIYPRVLRYIVDSEKTTCYMIVRETNVPSIRGIEKAGFEKRGKVEKSKLGKYKAIG